MLSGYSLKCFKLWWTHGKGRAHKIFSCACHLTFGCMLGLQRSFKTLQTDIKMRATMEPAKSELLGVGPSTEYLLEAVPCYARVQLCWKVLFSGAPDQPQPATGPHSLPVVASLSPQGESATSKEHQVWQPLWLSFQDVWGSVGSLTRDSLFHDLFNQMNFCLYVIHVHWHFCRPFRWKGPWEKS